MLGSTFKYVLVPKLDRKVKPSDSIKLLLDTYFMS